MRAVSLRDQDDRCAVLQRPGRRDRRTVSLRRELPARRGSSSVGDGIGGSASGPAIGGPRPLDGDGDLWEFAAEGTIIVEPEPAVREADGSTSARPGIAMFYCLDATTGKKVWSRRLQGAALHPAVVADGIVAVAASNSVVYRLSAKGGSILSWEAIPSRVVYEPASAGSLGPPDLGRPHPDRARPQVRQAGRSIRDLRHPRGRGRLVASLYRSLRRGRGVRPAAARLPQVAMNIPQGPAALRVDRTPADTIS